MAAKWVYSFGSGKADGSAGPTGSGHRIFDDRPNIGVAQNAAGARFEQPAFGCACAILRTQLIYAARFRRGRGGTRTHIRQPEAIDEHRAGVGQRQANEEARCLRCGDGGEGCSGRNLAFCRRSGGKPGEQQRLSATSRDGRGVTPSRLEHARRWGFPSTAPVLGSPR